ncbi:type I toxin-antitoxin system Fst family toxin [Lactobacillus taiwanensis]
MSVLKDFLTSVVAPILVGIVLALFDHRLDDWHNNRKH